MTSRQRFLFNFGLPFVPVSLPASLAVLVALCTSSAVAQFSFPNLFGIGRSSAPADAPRGSDVERWSDAQILQAVEDRDERLVQAIQIRAESRVGDPEFAKMMVDVLNRNSGATSVVPDQKGRPGEPGFPSNIDPPEAGEQLVPPGGAHLLPRRPLIPATRSIAVTSIEAMVGEALLGYLPQASGGSGGKAQGSGSYESGQADGTRPGANSSIGGPPSAYYESGGGPPGVTGSGTRSQYGAPGSRGNLVPVDDSAFDDTLEDEALLRAVVKALVTNATDVSASILEGLADGSIVSAVASPQLEEILLAEVFESHADADTVTAVVGTTAQNVLADGADPTVMTSIASLAATSTETILHLAEPVEQMTKDVDEIASARQRAQQRGQDLESEFYDSSDFASQFTQGGNIPGGAPAGAAQSTLEFKEFAAAANAADPIAAALWNTRTVTAINEQLASDTPSLELLALAINIPNDEVRNAMFGLFDRLHDAGAGGMVQSGLFSEFARDPAILPVLKALPRKRPSRRGDANGAADSTATWTEASYQALTALRDRLRSVDSNPLLAHSGKSPVPLHDRQAAPDASITIEAAASGSAGSGAVSPDPTAIHYTRLTVRPERTTEMQSIVDHYEKRAAAFKRVRESEKTLWYDGVKKNSDGTRTSIDVLIQEGDYKSAATSAPAAPVAVNPLTGGAPAASGQGGPAAAAGPTFTIEIITVTVRDPKDPLTTATASVN